MVPLAKVPKYRTSGDGALGPSAKVPDFGRGCNGQGRQVGSLLRFVIFTALDPRPAAGPCLLVFRQSALHCPHATGAVTLAPRALAAQRLRLVPVRS